MYQICVSGAAKGKSVEQSKDKAEHIGRLIAESNNLILTGALYGLPYHAAVGAKKAGGQSVGVSPATNKHEHVDKYRLPIDDAFDYILYSSSHYLGRDLLLVSSADAIIYIGGRMGTMHEFALGVEMGKPVAVLEGSGGTSELMKDVLNAAGIERRKDIIFESDPEVLFAKLQKMLAEEHSDHKNLHKVIHRKIHRKRGPHR